MCAIVKDLVYEAYVYTFLAVGLFVLGLFRLTQIAMFVTFIYYTWEPIWSPVFNYTSSIHWSLGVTCLMLAFMLAMALPALVEKEVLTRLEGQNKKRNPLFTVPIVALLCVLLGAILYELSGLWPGFVDILTDTSYGQYQPFATIVLFFIAVSLLGYSYIQDLERYD